MISILFKVGEWPFYLYIIWLWTTGIHRNNRIDMSHMKLCKHGVTGSLSFTELIQKPTNNVPCTPQNERRRWHIFSYHFRIMDRWAPYMCTPHTIVIIVTPILKPPTAQQKGDASDGPSETYAITPAFIRDGNLGLPSPAVMRENGGHSLRQQSSSPTESTAHVHGRI
jgi:hypothetical protein